MRKSFIVNIECDQPPFKEVTKYDIETYLMASVKDNNFSNTEEDFEYHWVNVDALELYGGEY